MQRPTNWFGYRGLMLGLTSLVAIAVLASTASTTTASQNGKDARRSTTPGKQPKVIAEMKDKRTRFSRTYRADDGSAVAKVYPMPVNYRTPGGGVAAIDNSLVPGPQDAVRNKANQYEARLPADLETPVQVAIGDEWVRYGLQDAAATRRVSDARAVYDDALPSTDVIYDAANHGLKETLVLRDADAPSVFRFPVTTSPGSSLRTDARGGIELVEGEEIVGRFAEPHAYDRREARTGQVADGQHSSLALKTGSRGQYLELAVDARWLRAPDRSFPVEVDPTFEYIYGSAKITGASQDATINEGFPTSSYGSVTTLPTGRGKGGWSTVRSHHAMLKFDVAGAIPDDSIVFSATFAANLGESMNANVAPVTIREINQAWTESATWNTSNGTAAWGANRFSVPRTANVQPAVGWNYWKDLGEVVQRWVDGTTPNNGLALTESAATPDNVHLFSSTNNADPAKWPHLQVWYTQRSGTSREYSFWTPSGHVMAGEDPDWDGSGRTPPISVNVATGNLLVRSLDRAAPADSPGLRHQRWHNSVWWGEWDYGRGWTSESWTNLGLSQYPDGSATFYAPSLFPAHFRRRPDGTFDKARGLDATLTQATDGTGRWIVTFPETGEKYYFASLGAPSSPHVNASGASTRWRTTSTGYEALSSASRANGYTNDPSNTSRFSQVRAEGQSYSYGYDTTNNLVSVTAPDGKITRYEYENDTSWPTPRRLTKIVEPDGSQHRFTYSGPFGRRQLASYTTRAPGATADGPTTRFSNGNRTTTITAPNGVAKTYGWDAQRRVTSWPAEPTPPSVLDSPRSDPLEDETGLAPSAESDPNGGTACEADAELGTYDYCETAPDTLSTLAAGLNPALQPGASGWGLAEQRSDFHNDARYGELNIRNLRVLAPWDAVVLALEALKTPADRRSVKQNEEVQDLIDLDRFIAEANGRGKDLLVSFGRSRDRGSTPVDETRTLPSPDAYGAAINAFLDRYRTVRQMVAWNEVNNGGQPTSFAIGGNTGPIRAAQYWKIVNSLCRTRGRTCVVLAGSFTDVDALNNENAGRANNRNAPINGERWSYWRQYVHALRGSRPTHWAVHPYTAGRGDVSASGGRDYTQYLRTILRRSNAVRSNSRIWLTEYGHQVDPQQGPTDLDFFFKDDVPGGSTNLRTVMSLLPISDRMERFYYYKFYDDTFNSGLIADARFPNENNVPRCIYFVYRYRTNPASMANPAPRSGCPAGAAPTDPFRP